MAWRKRQRCDDPHFLDDDQPTTKKFKQQEQTEDNTVLLTGPQVENAEDNDVLWLCGEGTW